MKQYQQIPRTSTMLEYDTETKKIIIVNYLITKPKVVKQRKIGPRNEFEVLEKTHGFWNDLSRRRQENQILFERKA